MSEAVKTYTTQMVLSANLNRHGSLFGGDLMAWMDLAAAIHAGKIMKKNCVTLLVDNILFKTPSHLGDIITFECVEIARGRTSLTVGIKVTKSNLEVEDVEIASSSFKFVAVDESGKSVAWNEVL